MFRRLLTYQLILAVAVGPLLCCCTTGRLLASSSQPAGSAPTPRSSAPAATTSPCCAHKHQPAKPNSDRGHSDPQPVPSKPGEKCPCKDGSGTQDTIQEVTSVDVSTLLRVVTIDLDTLFRVVDCTSCPSRFGQETSASRGVNASLPSTADLLFAHHKLRC